MTIQNFSLLNTNNFRFYIPRAEYLSFFTQNVSLPSISLPVTEENTPFASISLPGDHISFEPLNVQFIVDEDLNGYMEIFRWMNGIGFPNSFEEYQELVIEEKFSSRSAVVYEDIVITAMTGSRNSNIQYTFKDAHPVKLTAPTLSATNTGEMHQTCTATFEYTTFVPEAIKTS